MECRNSPRGELSRVSGHPMDGPEKFRASRKRWVRETSPRGAAEGFREIPRLLESWSPETSPTRRGGGSAAGPQAGAMAIVSRSVVS